MKKEFQNIIIRMPNWIGDLVMATPIIADLKKAFPHSNVTAMCQSKHCNLLLGNPYLDEIFSYSHPNEFLRREEKRSIKERLRQGRYDLGILLTNSFSSAWMFWRGKVENRIGYASDFRSFFLTKTLPFPKERGKEHLVKTYKRLLEPLGIPISNTSPSLYVTDEERRVVNEILRQRDVPNIRKLIGINPGAAYGTAKCWLPERFRSLTQKLLKDQDTYILYFGDEVSKELVNSICVGLPKRVINLAGSTTLRELLALIECCDAFVTNDSGPMHIAAALKTPLVALFGSTNDVATGPYKYGTVIHKHVECSPCYRRTCPIDFRCMKQIEVDEVYKEILKLLHANQ